MKEMQGFMALHRQTLEADYAEGLRRRAADTERRIRDARASGRLGNGRLADTEDIEAAGLFKTNGLSWAAIRAAFFFTPAMLRCCLTP